MLLKKQSRTMRRRVKLGQHFLIDKDVLADIIRYSAIKEGEKVLEVGPGKGVLTAELLKKGAKVTAVEIDSDLVEILRKKLGNNKNLKIINQDVLDFILVSHLASPDKLIGNIPYQITSPLLRKIFKLDNPPELIILMVQKEVAERICAKPGDSRRGFLSVVVQYYAKPEIIRIVPKESFYPVPKVESAIIRIATSKQQTANSRQLEAESRKLFTIVQAGFSQKRKKLRNSLAGGLQVEPKKMDKLLQKIGIDSNLRAEDLEIEEWIEIGNKIKGNKK